MYKAATALRLVHSAPALHVGDIVRIGDNRFPHYKIIAVSGERAWVRDVQFGTDHVVGMATVHRV